MNLLPSETLGKIPKLIWHTYKQFPPENSKPIVESWVNLNPDYTWMFMDDKRCNAFIEENFSKDFTEMYNALPIPVMKADVWRVAVIYAYGGVYSDLDCRCLKPISTWLNPDDELIVGVEVTAGDLLNYCFAAKPRHPALLSVLNEFVRLYNTTYFMDISTPSPVQNFGQFGFSNGILKYYDVSSEDRIKGGNSDFYNTINKVKEEKTKFILKQDNVFSTHIDANTCVLHEVASESWKDKTYQSWRKDQQRYINETN